VDQIVSNSLFSLNFWRLSGRPWTSAEVAGKAGLVERLATEKAS
jgi:hypothetical protein